MNATSQLLIFHLDATRFGIFLSNVDRVVHAVEVSPLPQAPDVVLGMIDAGGTVLPVFDVRRRFGIPARELSPDDQFIVAFSAGRSVALAVDRVENIVERGSLEIVEAEKILSGLAHVSGVVQLEDGLVLIHDLDRFLSLDEDEALNRALRKGAGDDR